MINNKGFGKFEVLTVFVLVIAIFAFLMHSVLGGANGQKVSTMKDSAISFSKIVTTNIASFHNTENVYLQEAIDEGLIGEIKSPVGRGNCSSSESIVQLIDGIPYVTLLCNNLLIEKTNFTGKNDVNVYKVSKWYEEKKEDSEKKVLFNCEENGKLVFPDYYEELYFIYEINKKYNTDYYYSNGVKECKVVSKTFYRTKKEIK